MSPRKKLRMQDSDSQVLMLIDRIEELEKNQHQSRRVSEPDVLRDHGHPTKDKDRHIKMDKFTGSEIISGAQWLSGYEKLAKLYKWSDKWKAENFLLHLGGSAHNWYCSMALDEEDWATVRKLFLDRYVLSKEDYWRKIHSTKWDPKKESLGDFYNRFSALGGYCGFDEVYIVRMLKELAMPDRYKPLMSVCKSDTLSGCYKELSAIVNLSKGDDTVTCNVVAHVTVPSDRKDTERVVQKKRRCFQCQSDQHLIAECPDRPPKKRAASDLNKSKEAEVSEGSSATK